MAILFNGSPQGALGNFNGRTDWFDPPWDYAPTEPQVQGGLAIPRNPQAQILQDANGRFAGQKYWRFEVAPGDQFQTQSGERVLLTRPQYWGDNNLRLPEELDGLPLGTPGSTPPAGRTGSPPWGTIRYWGMSLKLDSAFKVPHSWFLIWQQKMSQYNWSPWVQIAIRTDEARDGGLTAGADGPIRLSLYANVAKTTTSTPYIDRRPTAPNVDLTKNIWYDLIWGIKYATDTSGWARLWWKPSTSSSWTLVSYVENAQLGQWNIDAADTTVLWTDSSFGIYRGADFTGDTHVIWATGPYAATTFEDIANAIYGSPQLATQAGARRVRTRQQVRHATAFDGVDDQVQTKLGSTLQGYGTTVAIARFNASASTLQHLFGWYDNAGSGHAAPLQYDATNKQLRYFNYLTGSRTSVFTFSPGEEYHLLASRKATGTALPRFSWMSYWDRQWTHMDGGTSLQDHPITGGSGTIGISKLTSALPATSATSHTTASVSLTAGRVYIVLVYGNAVGVPQPTLTGASQTWDLIRSDHHTTSYDRRLTSFRCKPLADASGTLLISWGVTSTTAGWAVLEVTNMDTSGTNGAGAIGDSDVSSDTSGTTGSVPALTLTNSSSVNLAFWCHKKDEAITPEGGWTELADHTQPSTHSFEAEWQVNDTTATASWTTAAQYSGQAIEIIAGAASSAPDSVVFGRHVSGTTTAQLDGDLLACAWFGSKVLSDAQIEGLVDPVAWVRQQPTGMWVFDRRKLFDLTRRGANEIARTGTLLVES